MAAELFKWVTNVNLTHIAYNGSAPNLTVIVLIAESRLPDYEAVPYYTLSTSSKVPANIVRRLAADVGAFVKAADLQRRGNELGIAPLDGSAEAAVKRNVVETAK